MRVELIDTFSALTAYRAAWNRLLQQSPTNTVFQTFEWLESWWKTWGEEYELRALLGFVGDTLTAAAPLVLRRESRYGRPMACLAFASTAPADYLDFLYRDSANLRTLLQALRVDLHWDVLELERIPSESPTLPLLAEAFPGWRGTSFRCDVASSYVFDARHDGSDILKKKSIRRHLNGLQKVGAVEVQHLTRAADIEPHLNAFFAQHIERRALTTDPSLFHDSREQQFYRLLTPSLAAQEWLLFTRLVVNGAPIAFHYGFLHEQRLLWYKPSFAPQYAHLSPGEVLIAELFRYCRDRGVRELDFTIGPAAFKERFTNTTRANVQFQAFHNALWQRVGHVDRALRERAKQVRLVRRLHSLWSRVRRQSGEPGLTGAPERGQESFP